MHKPIHSALLGLLLTAIAACAGPGRHNVEPVRTVVRANSAKAVRAEIPIQVEVQGVIEAERTAVVSRRVMATIKTVRVDAGDPIHADQLLLTIDADAAQGQVAQARGALAQAGAAMALAERNYQRYQALAETKAASELEVDMARMQYEQALGAVEQGEGAVASAFSLAEDSQVTAPFSGRVVQRLVDIGDLAAPGRPLLVIESDGNRRLALAVPESMVAASSLTIGSSLTVVIDSRPDLGEISGTIVEMTPGADPFSHSFKAKVALPMADLSTGVVGRASITTGSRQSVTVPVDAVLRHGGLELVVLNVDGHTSSRAVTTGRTTSDGSFEILSGLVGGERVLVGLDALPSAGSVIEEID